MQLILMAKDQTDTGVVVLSSCSTGAGMMGCDRGTLAGLLRKFQQASRITVTVGPGTVQVITIANYEHYQRFATVDKVKLVAEKPAPISRPDQTKADQTRPKQTKAKTRTTRSNCPVQKIQDLFNQICTSLPQIDSIEDTRLKTLQARWKRKPDIEFWEKFFVTVQASDWLAGRVQTNRSWSATFDWIINSANFTKIIEGNYRNKTGHVEYMSPEAKATGEAADIAYKQLFPEAKNESK